MPEINVNYSNGGDHYLTHNPMLSAEWWPELTKVLAACIVKLLTFIKATSDTARRSLMPSENPRW